MKHLTVVFACLFSVSVYGQGACNNQSSVTHQGYEYDIVEIGDQCWFAENCRYLPEVSLLSEDSPISPYYYVYGYEGSNVEEAKATSNYETFGVIYNWPAVMTEGICPSSWHIPSDGEWQTMEISLGMSEADAAIDGWRGYPVGDYIKSTSGWNDGGNGSNSSGFNGLPGGLFLTDSFFTQIWVQGSWWTASEYGSSSSVIPSNDKWVRSLFNSEGDVGRYESDPSPGHSARCVRD